MNNLRKKIKDRNCKRFRSKTCRKISSYKNFYLADKFWKPSSLLNQFLYVSKNGPLK